MSELDILNMTDEEVANMSLKDLEVTNTSETTNSDTQITEPVEPVIETDTTVEADKVSNEEAHQTEVSNETDTPFNYEEEYKKLLAPFKANGRDMQVDSIEDARQLMQMGANYNKKMAALKPNLKLVKTLEQEGINEAELNYLIDLKRKDPTAVQKFIKESGINPLEIDTDEEIKYIPKDYTVSDSQVALDDVLSSIQDTPKFATTVDIISNKWDGKSRQVFSENPTLIATINEHIHNGIYDQIDAVMQKEKMLGRLTGMSDLEAYHKIGEWMDTNKMFNQGEVKPTTPVQTQVVQTKPVDNEALKQRKQAASVTRTTPAKQLDPNFNPLNMSDEDFAKMDLSKYL
jgi:hypothetical protein